MIVPPSGDARSRPVRLRAPRKSGELLARPRLDRASAALRANDLLFGGADRLDLQGRSFGSLRTAARESAAALARQYTAELTGDAPQAPRDRPLIVTGHQPVLFHPGVWAKQFATAGLAERHAGSGLNLVVDNDLLATTAVAVPRGPRATPHVELFPLSAPQPPAPWEEVPIDDARLFDIFGERVTAAITADWGYSPLLRDCWRDAVAAREAHPRLSHCLTAMRVLQERRFGVSNLELPLSRLEETEPFRWFLCHILVDAAQFRAIHNAELAAYRRRNRIRSRSHPVPELRVRDGWCEAPFWVWRAAASQRRPLFVRLQQRRVALACDRETIGELRLHAESDLRCAVDGLAELAHAGWKFRSRALTTTLYARLCLADLFIHGIGGAKYDELTDRLIERFYGLTPPAFLTLTATLHLPLGSYAASAGDLSALRHQLRDLQFNADRHLSGPAADAARQTKLRLLAERQAVMAESADAVPSGGDRRERLRRLHLELQALQADLKPLVTARREQLSDALRDATGKLAANRILAGREFAWCLYPEAAVRALKDDVVSACG